MAKQRLQSPLPSSSDIGLSQPSEQPPETGSRLNSRSPEDARLAEEGDHDNRSLSGEDPNGEQDATATATHIPAFSHDRLTSDDLKMEPAPTAFFDAGIDEISFVENYDDDDDLGDFDEIDQPASMPEPTSEPPQPFRFDRLRHDQGASDRLPSDQSSRQTTPDRPGSRQESPATAPPPIAKTGSTQELRPIPELQPIADPIAAPLPTQSNAEDNELLDDVSWKGGFIETYDQTADPGGAETEPAGRSTTEGNDDLGEPLAPPMPPAARPTAEPADAAITGSLIRFRDEDERPGTPESSHDARLPTPSEQNDEGPAVAPVRIASSLSPTLASASLASSPETDLHNAAPASQIAGPPGTNEPSIMATPASTLPSEFLPTLIIAEVSRLRRFAAAMIGDAAAADRLVQLTIDQALADPTAIASGRDLGISLLALLHEIRRGMKEIPEPTVTSISARSFERTILGTLPGADQHELMEFARAMATLAEDDRTILLLVALENLVYRDVAAVIRTPIGRIMPRIARARENLRQALAEGIQECGQAP